MIKVVGVHFLKRPEERTDAAFQSSRRGLHNTQARLLRKLSNIFCIALTI